MHHAGLQKSAFELVSRYIPRYGEKHTRRIFITEINWRLPEARAQPAIRNIYLPSEGTFFFRA